MHQVKLSTASRQLKAKQLKSLREQGQVPGIVYGQGKQPTLIQANAKTLDKIFHTAGTNKLVMLSVDEEKPRNVLFHEVQTDPISRQIKHFDLYAVRMDEKIKTAIPLHFIEEAPAVHTYSAILLKNIEEVEVEALPGNLPENFEVNLSVLAEIGDSIHVRDLSVSEGVTILADPDELIAKTDPPRSEEEIAELDEEIEEGAEAEVESDKGTAEAEGEGEESAEGESGEAAKAESQSDETGKKEDR